MEAHQMPLEKVPQGHELIEGVRIQLSPAPFMRRVVALIIDWGIVYLGMLTMIIPFAILMGVGMFSAIMASGAEKFASSAIMIVVLVAFVLAIMTGMHCYFIYFEFKNGATPGKRIMGLKVVSVDGSRLTKGQAVYRELVRAYIDALLFLPALISISVTERRQRVGDLLAGTMVIYSKAADDSERSLYVKREDYQSLMAHLQPKPVDEKTRKGYLNFANRAFLLNQEASLTSERTAWLQIVKAHLEKADELGLNDNTVLRFFAEFCFQSDLESMG
jgi:uncharacterized RDD family membrane protein YckC